MGKRVTIEIDLDEELLSQISDLGAAHHRHNQICMVAHKEFFIATGGEPYENLTALALSTVGGLVTLSNTPESDVAALHILTKIIHARLLQFREDVGYDLGTSSSGVTPTHDAPKTRN